MNGPRPEAASNLSHFLGVNPICLAEGGFGFAGGVTLLIHRGTFSLFIHTSSSSSSSSQEVSHCWYIALHQGTFSLFTQLVHIYQILIQPLLDLCTGEKTDSLDRLRHVFSVRCADTHSLNQRPHSAPVYITKWHFYDRNTMAFHVCLLLAFLCHQQISLTLWTPLVRWIRRPMQKYDTLENKNIPNKLNRSSPEQSPLYCVVVKSGENSQQQRSGQVSLDALLAHSNHSGHGRTADCIEKNHRVLSVGLSIAVEGVWEI